MLASNPEKTPAEAMRYVLGLRANCYAFLDLFLFWVSQEFGPELEAMPTPRTIMLLKTRLYEGVSGLAAMEKQLGGEVAQAADPTWLQFLRGVQAVLTELSDQAFAQFRKPDAEVRTAELTLGGSILDFLPRLRQWLDTWRGAPHPTGLRGLADGLRGLLLDEFDNELYATLVYQMDKQLRPRGGGCTLL
jgi:hypothetical protein